MARVVRETGEWTTDIRLPHGIWTKGKPAANARLERVVCSMRDFVGKPLSSCRFLDLACLEGQYSLELALQGAEVVGVEGREASVRKALFARDAYGLDSLELHVGDIRDISVPKYGRFDGILCSGILYHLEAADVFALVEAMYEMTRRLVVIDTHVSLQPTVRASHKGTQHHGHYYREHADTDSADVKASRVWASLDNNVSFWFSRPSLMNLLLQTGFSATYECINPAVNLEDRCTFVAVKADSREVLSAEQAEDGRWPEGSLSYHKEAKPPTFSRWARSLVRRILTGGGAPSGRR